MHLQHRLGHCVTHHTSFMSMATVDVRARPQYYDIKPVDGPLKNPEKNHPFNVGSVLNDAGEAMTRQELNDIYDKVPLSCPPPPAHMLS